MRGAAKKKTPGASREGIRDGRTAGPSGVAAKESVPIEPDEPVSLWENRISLTVRVVPGILERARWRNNLAYSLTDKLTIGIEYNPLADDVNPTANWRIMDEKGNWPSIMVGTSSDRIGTPEGSAFYLTVAKSLKKWTGVPIAPYAGVSYSTYDDRAYFIGGANLRLTDNLSAMGIYDGVAVHGSLSFTTGRHTFSLLAVDLDGWHLGGGYSVRF